MPHQQAQIISNCFFEQNNEFTVPEWPPKSPDLAPVEHRWDVVEHYGCAADKSAQLCDGVNSICSKISEECFQYLVESVP